MKDMHTEYLMKCRRCGATRIMVDGIDIKKTSKGIIRALKCVYCEKGRMHLVRLMTRPK